MLFNLKTSPYFTTPSQRKSEVISGFTLIETLVVIVIAGILAAIAIPSYLSQREKAQYAKARIYLDTMRDNVLMYRLENGRFPEDVYANIRPNGVEGNWYSNADMPDGGRTDYNHWGLGSNQCIVTIEWFGKNDQRNYPLYSAPAASGEIKQIEDDLVLVIEQYLCPNQPAGSIK